MTGTTIADIFKSASMSQFPFGTIEFDAAAIRIPQYSLTWKANKDSELSTAYMAVFNKATCVQNRCIEVALTPVNSTAWVSKRLQDLNPCVYTGGCTNYVPYIIAGGVAILVISVAIIFFFYRRQ